MLFFALFLPILASVIAIQEALDRQPKVFISKVVDNVPCSGNNGQMGVCTTRPMCLSLKGKESGSCNNGVCCQITLIPSPSPRNVTTVTQAVVTIASNGMERSKSVIEFPKRDGICQLKLNFLDTVLASPPTDPLRGGECAEDAFSVSGSPTIQPSGSAFFPSDKLTVCGDLAGQHMYLAYDNPSNAYDDKITFTIKTTKRSAKYKVEVIQIKCGSEDLAPSGCLQYFKEDSGRVKSFGFPYQLNDQYYQVCTKGKSGTAKSIEWKECSGGVGRARPFMVTGGYDNMIQPDEGDVICSADYVQLGSGSSLTSDRLCGEVFAPITVRGDSGLLRVNFDWDETGHSVILTNLPASMKCDMVIASHQCHPVTTMQGPACVCVLDQDIIDMWVAYNITILADEKCPPASFLYGFLGREGNDCRYTLRYDEADSLNSGFCLEYTHKY